MAGLLSLCRSATLRLGVFALNPFAPIVHPKMNTGKEPFQCGMRNADVGVIEHQSNKRIKFAVLVAWFLGCSKISSGQNEQKHIGFHHRQASCVTPRIPLPLWHSRSIPPPL
jgi:hypothetical protein